MGETDQGGTGIYLRHTTSLYYCRLTWHCVLYLSASVLLSLCLTPLSLHQGLCVRNSQKRVLRGILTDLLLDVICNTFLVYCTTIALERIRRPLHLFLSF